MTGLQTLVKSQNLTSKNIKPLLFGIFFIIQRLAKPTRKKESSK
jgi:hypothetical protein